MSKNENALNKAATQEEYFERMPVSYLKQHTLLIITFTTLFLTGLPLLAPKFILFKWTFANPNVIEVRAFIHRAAGLVFVLSCVYHVFFLIFNKQGRKDFILMLPTPKDATDAAGQVMYNLGLRKEHPKYGRFNWIEKFEYLALIWGSIVMIVTGVILWFNNSLLAIFPKVAFDISTIVHACEAVLAGLAVLIWHMYTVHLHADVFPMNRTFIDGKISKKLLKSHHYLEYVEIMKERGLPVEEPDHGH